MAIVAITIKDLENGIDVDIRSDAPIGDEPTMAQTFALFITTLLQDGGDIQGEELDGSTHAPSLELPTGVDVS